MTVSAKLGSHLDQKNIHIKIYVHLFKIVVINSLRIATPSKENLISLIALVNKKRCTYHRK